MEIKIPSPVQRRDLLTFLSQKIDLLALYKVTCEKSTMKFTYENKKFITGQHENEYSQIYISSLHLSGNQCQLKLGTYSFPLQ